jgi:hypothetical protein
MHAVRAIQDVLGSLAHGDIGFAGKGVGFEEYKTIVGFERELSLKVGDGGNREGGISWGCLTPPLLHRRSDMPCPEITSSS